jgi:UDP-N-acetylmuramoyl-L-alanyl-D-glutamate--2,6-diaminopimelate ligase
LTGEKSIRLKDLLKELPHNQPFKEIDVDDQATVSGITADSRQVRPGDLFVALVGGSLDGHHYISDAVKHGAAAVAGSKLLRGLGIPYVQLEDARRSLAHLAAAFYGFPARQLTVIGITGTDGKTTTANLVYQILRSAELRPGMISTVNAVIGDMVLDTGFHVTTPDPIDVQRILAEMVEAGLTHVILEATSHGLAQYRVEASEFDIAVVTNITHEHLDYHGSYEEYQAAKGRLFTSLAETYPKDFKPVKGAVINRDDRSYDYLASITPIKPVSYGLHLEADIRAEDIVESESGVSFLLTGEDLRLPITTQLRGTFNVLNCLAAAAVCLNVMELEPEDVQDGIAAMEGVPGRMERLDCGQPFTAIIDFAHTPNALKVALEAGRQIAGNKGRVIAVFGSAGLRDREKRRLMAETSARLADLTVLTAEDPRTESLENILAEMAAGAVSKGGVEGETFWRVPDRGVAIRFALSMAKPGDVVMSCGKGHEQSMCFGTKEYDWDDRTAMKAALCELMHRPGPEMPFLPTQNQESA